MSNQFKTLFVLMAVLGVFLTIQINDAFSASFSAHVWTTRSDVEVTKLHLGYPYDAPRGQLSVGWDGAAMKLKLSLVADMVFTKNNDYFRNIDVTFKDGSTDRFSIQSKKNASKDYYVSGVSKHGPWKIAMNQVKRINFMGEKGTTISSAVAVDVDKIIMKNGDILSGKITTPDLTLKASYGDLVFLRKDIRSINFEGGGSNTDSVVLKAGDKMSGQILNNSIAITLTNKAKITIDKEKVKQIVFKK
jgi:hypothetical protein